MRLGVATQQPGERLSYSVSYTKALTVSDTINTVVASVDPAGELMVDPITTSSTGVQFWVGGGVDGTRYKITLTADTGEGRVFEDELYVVVREL